MHCRGNFGGLGHYKIWFRFSLFVVGKYDRQIWFYKVVVTVSYEN